MRNNKRVVLMVEDDKKLREVLTKFLSRNDYEVLAAENGKDWKEQVDEIAEIMEYGVKKGIDMGGVIFGQSVKTDTNEGQS